MSLKRFNEWKDLTNRVRDKRLRDFKILKKRCKRGETNLVSLRSKECGSVLGSARSYFLSLSRFLSWRPFSLHDFPRNETTHNETPRAARDRSEVPSLHTNYSLVKLFIHCSPDETVDRRPAASRGGRAGPRRGHN